MNTVNVIHGADGRFSRIHEFADDAPWCLKCRLQMFLWKADGPRWRCPNQKCRATCSNLYPLKYWQGKKRSPETVAKVSATMKAQGNSVGEKNPMYGGGSVEILCRQCAIPFLIIRSRSHKPRFCSVKCMGDWMSANLRPLKPLPGTPGLRRVREYVRWRKAVLARDGETCQMCGVGRASDPAVVLHVDHIQPLRTHPELAYELSNGRCLCRPCHYKLPTHGGKGRRWPVAA